ncbi:MULTISPECIES: hypothetical protein [unclassified Bradyrhizobium]|nr:MULTISPECIES: hypothetical protein [unclassified Bradyrhizobium]
MHPLAKLVVTVRALAVYALAVLLIVWVVGPRLNHGAAPRAIGITSR